MDLKSAMRSSLPILLPFPYCTNPKSMFSCSVPISPSYSISAHPFMLFPRPCIADDGPSHVRHSLVPQGAAARYSGSDGRQPAGSCEPSISLPPLGFLRAILGALVLSGAIWCWVGPRESPEMCRVKLSGWGTSSDCRLVSSEIFSGSRHWEGRLMIAVKHGKPGRLSQRYAFSICQFGI